MKLWNKDADSGKKMMLLLLLAAGVMEFLFITLESMFSGLAYYLLEDYIIVPALLFLGCALAGQLPKFAKRRLLLASAAICWFVLVQFIHKLCGEGTHPIGTVFFVYLMAFPFASAAQDRDSAGLDWIGGMFLTAAMVLVGYTALLLTDTVPGSLQQHIFWDGTRLHVFWHPNITACFLMIGIGFAAVFLLRSKKMLWKILMALSIAAQMAVMAMTNCRTTLLMTGALLGAILLLAVLQRFRPVTRRKLASRTVKIILCVVLALVILVGVFLVAGKLYQWNNERLLEEAGAESLEGENSQRSLADDMRTLNGRTIIWKGARSVIRDNRRVALFGTEYSGMMISQYRHLEVVHGHNSWVEAMLRMGLPGLALSLVFTVLTLWSAVKLVFSPSAELWQKVLAMLTVCLLGAGFLEPYLFITNVYYHVTDFAFFFLAGYLDYWANIVPKTEN